MKPKGNETVEVEEKEDEKEDLDGAEDADGAEGDDAESKPGEGADSDGARGDGEGGEGSGDADEKGDEDHGEEDAGEPDLATQFAELQERYNALEEKVNKPPEKVEEKSQPRQRTQEEWDALSKESGLPVESLSFIEANQTRLVQGLISHFSQMLDSRLGNSEKDQSIQEMAKKPEFKDIGNYRSGIDEFLKKYQVKDHSNPALLEHAYFYAKGRGADKKVRKVMDSKEINRKVIKKVGLKTGSGKSVKAKDGRDLTLTAEERRIWNTTGKNHYETEEEYAAALPRNRK